eukprot:1158744-Pelagomonas_calceolata.AAC.17
MAAEKKMCTRVLLKKQAYLVSTTEMATARASTPICWLSCRMSPPELKLSLCQWARRNAAPMPTTCMLHHALATGAACST